VTQNHLCFASIETFIWTKGGHKFAIDTKTIEGIQQKGKSIIITRQHKGKLDSVEFSNFKNISEIYEFFNESWHQKLTKEVEKTSTTHYESNSPIQPQDWEKLEQAAEVLTYGAGDVILYPSSLPDRCVYMIKQGTAKIESRSGKDINISNDAIFGMEAFLLNCSEDQRVVAITENTKIYRYEAYYLDILQIYNPQLAGCFYLHLANEIAQKLFAQNNNSPPPK